MGKRFLIYLCLLVFIGCSSEKSKSGFYQEIKSTDKMVFAGMSVTKTAVFKHDDNFKIGKRIAAYSYDTYLQAYIDLSDLKEEDIELNENEKRVKIILPPIQTEVKGRDIEGLRKVYDNIGVFRHRLNPQERAEILEEANTDLLKEVSDNPRFRNQLKEAARKKARTYFETLFESKGYAAEVEFKDSRNLKVDYSQ